MTIGEFAEAVAEYGKAHEGSVTSWGRSVARTRRRKIGFVGDPHNWWYGVDLVYETPSGNIAKSETHVRNPQSCSVCNTLLLKIIHEPGHDHVQPRDYPAGPLVAGQYPLGGATA